MKTYKNFESIERDLKILNLERQIALEERISEIVSTNKSLMSKYRGNLFSRETCAPKKAVNRREDVANTRS